MNTRIYEYQITESTETLPQKGYVTTPRTEETLLHFYFKLLFTRLYPTEAEKVHVCLRAVDYTDAGTYNLFRSLDID